MTVDPAEVTGDSAKAHGGALEDLREIEYDYWIDRYDRTRRVTVELFGQTTTVSMTDWNAQLVLEVPGPEMLIEPGEAGPAPQGA